MVQKELLREKIEEERRKLNQMVERSAGSEETYRQSVMLDRMIEQYLEL